MRGSELAKAMAVAVDRLVSAREGASALVRAIDRQNRAVRREGRNELPGSLQIGDADEGHTRRQAVGGVSPDSNTTHPRRSGGDTSGLSRLGGV